MDKQEEIKILRSLQGDTYFNQFFKTSDIKQMCENIKNDFPIELGCQFNEKATLLQHLLDDAKANILNKEEEMVANFIKLNKAAFTEEFYHYCAQRVGKLFIIKCKREEKLPLTDEELDYLIKVADKHINPENYQNSK